MKLNIVKGTKQKSSYKKYLFAALGVTAVMLGGFAIFYEIQEDDFNFEAAHHFINFLSNHKDHMVSTHNTLDDLIIEGRERKVDTEAAFK